MTRSPSVFDSSGKSCVDKPSEMIFGYRWATNPIEVEDNNNNNNSNNNNNNNNLMTGVPPPLLLLQRNQRGCK